MKEYYIGIDVGGTKCAVILGKCTDGDMSIVDKIAFPTESNKGYMFAVNNIYAAIEEILKKYNLGKDEVEAMGVSCGGPLDSKTGRVLSPPNLPGWDDIPIVDMLEEKFGIETYLQNDANACGLAEWKFGAAKGYNNAIFCTFGTGLGAGLILNGKLYEGTNGNAGEVGHMRISDHGPVGYGKEGSFEGFCSGGGIAQIAKTKVLERIQRGEKPSFCPDVNGLNDLNAKNVSIAADEGDELAISIYTECAHYLGKGLSILIDILNPEVIVLGSIYARSENLLAEECARVIAKEALPASAAVCKVVPAKLGNAIGDFAALSVAYDKNGKAV